MLCTIESIERILERQKDQITIGNSDDDTITVQNAEQAIREADVIINSMLRGIYQLPLRNRVLLPKAGLSSTKSLSYQPESSRQLVIIIGGNGDLIDNNTVVIKGKDAYGISLEEGMVFTHTGAQVTSNFFKTVDTDGIEIGSGFLDNLEDSYIIILSYDVLNYVCQRIACYNIYRDVFSANSPNDLPITVKEWKDEAIKILEKLRSKTLTLDNQFAPSDMPIIDRPVYNIPTKFFEHRGVARVERLEDSDYQDYDGDHPDSTEGGTDVGGITISREVIIPPDTWTTSSRPLTPTDGQSGYNTETKQWEGWNGTHWVILG